MLKKLKTKWSVIIWWMIDIAFYWVMPSWAIQSEWKSVNSNLLVSARLLWPLWQPQRKNLHKLIAGVMRVFKHILGRLFMRPVWTKFDDEDEHQYLFRVKVWLFEEWLSASSYMYADFLLFLEQCWVEGKGFIHTVR